MAERRITIISPKMDERVVLTSTAVANCSQSYSEKCSVAYYAHGDVYAKHPIELRWECEEEPLFYTIKIGEESIFEVVEEQRGLGGAFLTPNLHTGKVYCWQVAAYYEDSVIRSAVFRFTTAQLPRTIWLEGVSNTRDIGGYMTESGRRVRQGMVYRGASLNKICLMGKETANNVYGIKWDLDLRCVGEEGAGQMSPLGESVQYRNIPAPFYLGSKGITNPANYASLAENMRFFADLAHYPVYLHCSLGRDRTGTLCLLLEGLLGMKKEDLFLEYELSFLSESGCSDGNTVDYLVNIFDDTYAYLLSYGGEDEEPFSTHVKRFLLDIGVTNEDLHSIERCLLESAVSELKE